MSHITTIRTELKNLNMVQAALRRLGYEYELGGSVEDYANNKQVVDVVVQIPGQRSVGFRRNEKTGIFDLVGDWWGGEKKEEEFLEDLKGNYAREQVLESLEAQGVDLSNLKEIEQDDGSVIFELPLEDDEMEALVAGA